MKNLFVVTVLFTSIFASVVQAESSIKCASRKINIEFPINEEWNVITTANLEVYGTTFNFRCESGECYSRQATELGGKVEYNCEDSYRSGRTGSGYSITLIERYYDSKLVAVVQEKDGAINIGCSRE